MRMDVSIGNRPAVKYRPSTAVKIAELANRQGLALITPEIVSMHANNKILDTLPARGKRFLVSGQGIQKYFTWLATDWHGANLIRTAITKNRLFEIVREKNIRLYNPIVQMIEGDIKSGLVRSAGRIKMGGRVHDLFNAKSAYEYVERLKNEIPKRENASTRLILACGAVEKVIGKIGRNPYNVEYTPKALASAERVLAGTDRKLDPIGWDELKSTYGRLKKIAWAAEKKVAISNAREKRKIRKSEKERLRIEKKAMAQMRRKALENESLEGHRTTRLDAKIVAELNRKKLLTTTGASALAGGKISPSQVLYYFKKGSIPGAYLSKYKTRSGSNIVVIPEKSALNFIKQFTPRKQDWVAYEKKPEKRGRPKKARGGGREDSWKEPAEEISGLPELRQLRAQHREAIYRLQKINEKLPVEILENTAEENMPEDWKKTHKMVADLAKSIRELEWAERHRYRA